MLVTEKDYYSIFPDGSHATGDIWMGLPSGGILTWPRITGLVVTPACDLANCKTETITYVPIVPLDRFYRLPEFRTEVARSYSELLAQLGILKSGNLDLLEDSDVIQRLGALQPNKEKLAIKERCMLAYSFLTDSSAAIRDKSGRHILHTILGKNWLTLKQRIVRNGYRQDIYYLPPDYQNDAWSPVPQHSVVLLRYLITVPTYFLDIAHRSDESSWPQRRTELIQRGLHCSRDCEEHRPPLRALRLRDIFLSDLLTKLVSIYVRIGAPDLSPPVLHKIENEI